MAEKLTRRRDKPPGGYDPGRETEERFNIEPLRLRPSAEIGLESETGSGPGGPSMQFRLPKKERALRKSAEAVQKEDRVKAPKAAQKGERLPAAPAIHTKGNAPLVEKILAASEQKRSPKYDTKATEPVFKEADVALTKEMVPQKSIQDRLPPYPDPSSPFPKKDRARPIHENREAIAKNIVSRMSGEEMPFYSTGTVLQGLIDQGGLTPEQAYTFMRDWSGQGAAMSPQTKTPENMRNASLAMFRQAQGNPITPESWQREGNLPGYPMIGGLHPRLSQEFFAGANDPWKNPKPSTFQEAWSGNMADVVADQHNIVATLDALDRVAPGSVPRGWFQNQDAYDRYTSEGGFPATGPIPDKTLDASLAGQQIEGRPAQTEYPILQGPTYDAARMLGVSPSEVQERMWFEFGPRTGLRSPPMTIPDLMNSQIESTSRATGVDPFGIMKLFAKRQIPLTEADVSDVPGYSTTG